MTKNNLKQNLDWLTKSSYAFPEAYPTPPLTELSTIDFHDPFSTEGLHQHSQPSVAGQDQPSDALPTPDSPNFLRPTAPASALNGHRGDDMARLQTEVKPRHRPRLLSENVPTPSRATPSLKAAYTNSFALPSDQSVEQMPASQTNIHGANLYNQAAVAGEVERASSSSTFETFGESKALWTEASAARKGPAERNGKKRKSDELEVDELQLDHPYRLSQGSFTAIDDFSDGGTPSKIKPSSPTKVAHKSLKRKATDTGSSEPRTRHQDSLEPTMSPTFALKSSPNRVLTQIWKPQTPVSPSSQQPLSIKAEEITRSSVEGVRTGSIADSEDSEEDGLSHAESRTAGYFKRKKPENTPAKPHASQEFGPPAGLVQPTPDLLSKAGTRLRAQSFKASQVADDHSISGSPFQRDSPTKMPLDNLVDLQPATNSQDIQDRPDVDTIALNSFLNYEHRRFQAHLDTLYRDRRSASEALYRLNIAGEKPHSDLSDQPALLTEKIKSMESLSTLRKVHVRLTKAKENSKARLIDMITRDCPPKSYEDDLKALHGFLDSLSRKSIRICSLLAEVDLPLGDDSSASDDHSIMKSEVIQDIERSKLLVQSTPATQRQHAPAKHESRLTEENDMPLRHFVQQTQAGPGMAHLEAGQKSNGSLPKASQSLPKTHGEALPTDVEAYFSPSRKGTQDQSPERDWFKTASPGKLRSERYHRSPHIYSDKDPVPFTMNMGSPQRETSARGTSVLEEDFGRDEDDVDMLEVVDELEKRPQEALSHYTSTRRDALAETSGNVMRGETSKALASFAPLPPTHSQMQHPWSRDVKLAMKDRFHLRGFRPNQLEAINATLSGKDTFVLMPTGGGKSLCYQLPSIITSGKSRGVTVVISPLLSLMQDQVEHLQQLRIQALLINGEVSAEHRRLVMDSLQNSDPQKFCQLLYITPEMINNSNAMQNALRNLHHRRRLARIVIDEAHCVSQWGHDFRPDYKQLGEIRRQFHGIPLIALTATATENVKIDIIHNLNMNDCQTFTQSFNRPNLSYEVRVKGKGKEVIENIAKTINESYRGQTGIIYCLSKKNCEDLAAKLRNDYKIRAQHYHAGIEPEQKQAVQKAWQSGQYHVIVATIAFGMGIDKPDVRYVIHHTIPKSLEGYYQETGRAGRDGRKSGCILYYGYGDSSALKRMIDDGEGSFEQKERQRTMLRKVVQFCENRSDCRRVQILSYFNETFKREDCEANCDNCASNGSFVTEDLTEYATIVIKLVEQIQEDNVTILHCIDIVRGSKTKKISELGHEQLPQFGKGSHLDRGHVERLLYRLLGDDALTEINKMNRSGFANQYVRLGRNAREYRSGRRKLKLQVRQSPKGKPQSKSKPKKRGTGVVAARTDYPVSTNVSSPTQALSRRKIGHVNRTHTESDEDFVVNDEEDLDSERGDSSDDFESVKHAGDSRAPTLKNIGPPITADKKLTDLDEVHRFVVDHFVEEAKRKNEEIYRRMGLRDRPFTDSILRSMAINFTKTENQMMRIPGIAPDKVQLYGHEFKNLVHAAQQNYHDMMQDDDRPPDPNRNVVEISSDSDADPGETADDDLDFTEGERSSFWPDPEVEAFNQRLGYVQSQPVASNSKKPPKAPSKAAPARRGRGGFRSDSRRSSGSNSKGKAAARGKSSTRGKRSTNQQTMTRFNAMPT